MANLHELPNPPVRMLLSGFPGTGKTTALAALANAGFKLRIIDLDGNWKILRELVNPGADVDLVSLEDNLRMGSTAMGADGIPTAFSDADRLLDRWRYKQGDEWVDLGRSQDWGQDTIICLDNLSGLTAACWYRAQVLSNTPSHSGDQRKVYQLAADEQLAFIRKLNNAKKAYHVIVISHLKLVGPQEITRNEEEHVKDFKRYAAEAVPPRLCPTAVGKGLAQNIDGEFDTHVRAVASDVGGKLRRTIEYTPHESVNLKLPIRPDALASLGRLDTTDGLVKLFAAMGHKGPTRSPFEALSPYIEAAQLAAKMRPPVAPEALDAAAEKG